MHNGRAIRLVEEDDGWWSAVETDTGVASQRPSTEGAFENLVQALELAA